MLDEFLTESVPEIDIAIKYIGIFDKVCVEMFVEETTPLMPDLVGRKEKLDSTTIRILSEIVFVPF